MESAPFERPERALGGPKLARAVPKDGPPEPSGVSSGKKAVCLVDETGEAIGLEVYVAMLGASNQAFTEAPRPSGCRLDVMVEVVRSRLLRPLGTTKASPGEPALSVKTLECES